MPDIATVAPGALDRFVLDLVEAGFETYDGRNWRGPIDPSLVNLTEATTMSFHVADGWPYLAPQVAVEGLRPSAHLNGNVLCLWRLGDESLAWLRLVGIRERIARWTEQYRERATLDDPVLDPHLSWIPTNGDILATLDLSRIRWGDGGSGETTAARGGNVVRIGEAGPLRVRWFGREAMRLPPVNITMLSEGLKKEQARNLERELARVGHQGGPDILMFVWNTPVGEPNVLVLQTRRDDLGEVRAEAIEVARTDSEVLIRRAGSDAPMLRMKSVVLFGLGAIGSNVSLLLARSGLGKITVLDPARLRPGDLVRHAGLAFSVGDSKVNAVSFAAGLIAPWTNVQAFQISPWDPTTLVMAAAGAHLIIDAVGETSFMDALSRTFIDDTRPLLSVALFRGGSLARVRVRGSGGMPFHERGVSFPTIAPGQLEETPTWETGCASPVNNAPPVAVVSAAALAARTAIEILTGRETGTFDAVEVYSPIERPFDLPGARRYNG